MIKQDFWQSLVKQVVAWGCSRQEVIGGSIPSATLAKISSIISGHGLQIGGFVGITHCYLAKKLKNGSMCTIDPNIPHRGINNPMLIANRLVGHFKLKNSQLIYGYAIQQMKILENVGSRYDFILLDGNHNYDAVREEIFSADRLLKPGGLLILDDIDHWKGPKTLYSDFPLDNYEIVPLDNRAGVMKKTR